MRLRYPGIEFERLAQFLNSELFEFLPDHHLSGYKVRGRRIGCDAEQPRKCFPGFDRLALLNVGVAEHVINLVGPRAGGNGPFKPRNCVRHACRKKAALSQEESGLTIIGAGRWFAMNRPGECFDGLGIIAKPEIEHAGGMRDLRGSRVKARDHLLGLGEPAGVEEADGSFHGRR